MRPIGVMWRLLALAGVVLPVAGCTLAGEPPPAATDAPRPERDAGWRLVAGHGPGGELEPGRREPTLVLRPRRIAGFGGCNEFTARARVRGGRIRVRGPIESTPIGCRERVAALEEGYFAALLDVERLERADGRLVLTGPSTRLVFEPIAPVDRERLDGPTWTLESSTVDGVTRRAGERPSTLRFTRDGRIEAFTPCRDLRGRYVVRRHEVALTAGRMSRRDQAGCPREAIEEEAAVVGALGDRFRVELDGERLRIESRDGYVLVLRAE